MDRWAGSRDLSAQSWDHWQPHPGGCFKAGGRNSDTVSDPGCILKTPGSEVRERQAEEECVFGLEAAGGGDGQQDSCCWFVFGQREL